MPLYDYTCPNCGDFEAWRTMAEVSRMMACPDCDAESVRLLIAPNINLNVGSFRKGTKASSEPRLVKRQEEMRPKPKNQSQKGGRPI